MFRVKYLDFYFYVCQQTEIKTCLDYVLDIAHDSTNQDSITYMLQKREVNFNEVQQIEIKLQLIENRNQDSSAKFYFSPNTTKTVGKFRPQLIELTSFNSKLLIRFIMNKTC